MTPRSILKNSTPSSSKPVNERHREVALHHANIIQSRKDVEEQILQSTMTLMDFPSASDADPARPTQNDASQFRSLLLSFQPTDYDSLIEERNIAEKCGYALCPRPPNRAPLAGKHQFVDTKEGVKIVDRKTLEIWCSDDCARRALYVKVQLSEEPAWLRRGGIGDNIDILVENVEEQHKALPIRSKPKELGQSYDINKQEDEEDEEEQAWALRDEALAELATERGEKPDGPSKANKELIKAKLEERVTAKAPKAPSSGKSTSNSHMAIEGHVPKADAKANGKKGNEEDEEDDNDWDD